MAANVGSISGTRFAASQPAEAWFGATRAIVRRWLDGSSVFAATLATTEAARSKRAFNLAIDIAIDRGSAETKAKLKVIGAWLDIIA